MTRILHTLLVAARPADALLGALRRAGYDPRPHRAATPETMEAAFARRTWDVIIVWHEPGHTSAWDVIGWLEREASATPIVAVVGEIDDEEMVMLIEAGVHVVPKQGLGRLGMAVAKALRERRDRNDRAASLEDQSENEGSDSTVRSLVEHLPIGLYRTTEDGEVLFANPVLAHILGSDSTSDLVGQNVNDLLAYPREDFKREMAEAGGIRRLEMNWERADGEQICTREHTRAVRDGSGNLLYYEGTIEDITEEDRVLQAERRRVEQLEAVARFSAAVDEVCSAEDIHRAAVDAVEEATGSDAAVLVRFADETFSIEAWSQTLPEDVVRACEGHAFWKSFSVHTKPVMMRDEASTESDLIAPLRDVMRGAGFRALGSFPLMYRGRPLGAIVALFREPHTFTESDLHIAESLSWHVAGALTRWKAENELRDSEASLRTMVDTTGHVLYRRRFGASTYDHLSASVEKLTGYTPDALQEMGSVEALAEAQEVIEGHSLKEGEAGPDAHYLALYHILTADGERRWVEDSATSWVDETGAVVGIVGMLRDVTEQRAREETARAQNRRSLAQQRALGELSTMSVEADVALGCVTEVVARTVDVGRVGLWLREGEDIVCKNLFVLDEAVHQTDASFRADALADVLGLLESSRVLTTPDVLAKPAKERTGLDVYHARNGVRAVLTVPVRRQGRVVGFITLEHLGTDRTWTLDEQVFTCAVADLVTLTLERGRRALAETALRESELRYRVISELAADFAYGLRIDDDGTRIDWATKAFERVSGYTTDELGGLEGMLGILHEADRPAVDDAIRKLRDGHTAEVEFRIRTKDGGERWVHQRSRPVRDEVARTLHVYSTGSDITERKAFEMQLVESRETAEAFAQAKGNFLASMSHEIRTPLTGIIGFSGVLAEEVEGEQRSLAQIIEKSGRRLLATLNSVLDLAQLDADSVELSREPLDVVEEARQAVMLLSPLARAKEIDLHLSTGEDEVVVPLDPVYLHRVFNNLVGNGIKFTEAGSVTVGIVASVDRVEITVRDTGIGIDEAFVPHLFDEFKREHVDKEDERTGSGLGLAITKKLVEMMGGTISVESAKGHGSTFSISFSRMFDEEHVQDAVELAVAKSTGAQRRRDVNWEADIAEDASAHNHTLVTVTAEVDVHDVEIAAASNDLASEEEALIGEESVEAETEQTMAPADSAREPEEPLPAPAGELVAAAEPASSEDHDASLSSDDDVPDAGAERRKRVLVVEDTMETRRLMERMLEQTFEVEAVADARAALDCMTKGTYDALLLDINIGGKQTGMDVLRIARTLPGYGSVTAVAVTAYALPGDAERFLSAGFDRYLSKPFRKKALLEALTPETDAVPERRA